MNRRTITSANSTTAMNAITAIMNYIASANPQAVTCRQDTAPVAVTERRVVDCETIVFNGAFGFLGGKPVNVELRQNDGLRRLTKYVNGQEKENMPIPLDCVSIEATPSAGLHLTPTFDVVFFMNDGKRNFVRF